MCKATDIATRPRNHCKYVWLRHTTAKGFEPSRAEPNGFRVHLLNHSDTLSYASEKSIWYCLIYMERTGKSCTKESATLCKGQDVSGWHTQAKTVDLILSFTWGREGKPCTTEGVTNLQRTGYPSCRGDGLTILRARPASVRIPAVSLPKLAGITSIIWLAVGFYRHDADTSTFCGMFARRPQRFQNTRQLRKTTTSFINLDDVG